MKKKLIIILGIVVVGGGLFALNASQSGEKGRSVLTEAVFTGSIEQMVAATGRIVPPTEVKISANISGRITNIAVEEGDAVTKGQLLVGLDRDRYEFAVRKARASKNEAAARLKTAALDWNRKQELYSKKLISQQEFDDSQARHETAEYALEQTVANLQQVDDNLDECTIHSPIDGIVTNLTAKQGENVVIGTMNNPGTVIMTVSDLSVIEIEAVVDETDVASIEVGHLVAIKLDAFPDTVFNGEVARIGNSANISGFGSQDQATSFLVFVRLLDDVNNIKPGMTSDVDITTDLREEVLQIPIQALVMRDREDSTASDDTPTAADSDAGVVVAAVPTARVKKKKSGKPDEMQGVFIIEDGKAVFREVMTGIADQQYIEIVSGIEDEQEIITGSFRILRELKDGDPVKVDNSQLLALGRGEA
jgi:HlyD family secretion protein